MTTKLKAANLNATYSADQYLKTSAAGALSWGAVDALPSQTSESGKFLTTDGSDASWATVSTTSYPSDAWTFRLTTGFNGSQVPITNGFTKIQYLGSDTFADPSSGVFTFPSTGV